MKLTEAKLKQLIRESMGQSEYYTKLKSLMSTEEGFLQAESLFEMVESSLEPQEAAKLKIYFETVDLAKELYTLRMQADEAREKFEKIEDELVNGAPIDAEADAAYSHHVRTSNAHYRKKESSMQECHQCLKAVIAAFMT